MSRWDFVAGSPSVHFGAEWHCSLKLCSLRLRLWYAGVSALPPTRWARAVGESGIAVWTNVFGHVRQDLLGRILCRWWPYARGGGSRTQGNTLWFACGSPPTSVRTRLREGWLSDPCQILI